MAKMFYSLDEAAQRMGVTPSEVRDMVSQGRLQEFRDRDKLMFKVEQVELLAGGHEDESGGSSMIPLADPGGSGIAIAPEPQGLGGSGSGSGIAMAEESPKERSGISIFDADQLEEADPSAVTQITASQAGGGELTMESVGSGSGLLDLTREGDDTSLGADLLEGVYAGGEGHAAASETAGTSGLFETTGAASDVSAGAAPVGLLVAPEPFDGTWSGLSGGVALGVATVAALAMAIVIIGLMGVSGSPLMGMAVNSFPGMWLGASAGIVIVFAIIGWLIGRKG